MDIYDLEQFAPSFFQISNKSGQIVPFIFNKSQIHVHKVLEEQLKSLGYVRANILKGRQQGCCYSPDMKVLTSDYRWVTLQDIKVGDNLLAVDEESVGHTISGRKSERRIRETIVEEKVKLKRKAFLVTLENGTKLKVTGEHRHLCLKRSGTDTQWRKVENCKIGDSIRAFCNAPDDEFTFDDGWFGGLLDGEGSFGANPGLRIALSQIDGAVLRKAKEYLKYNNIKYYELIDNRKKGKSSKLGDKPVHCLRIDRITDILKLLTKCQPQRFINRKIFSGKKLPKNCHGFKSWVKIMNIESIGEIEVIDLQTSEKTFVCEGMVSHNSTYISARYFHKVLTIKGTQAFILTHMGDATRALFDMTKRYNNLLPKGLAPTPNKDNENQLLFNKLSSGYRVGTAGSKEIGRSMTNQLMHLSEYAFYDSHVEIKRGIEQTVADIPGTEKIKESTANGVNNPFYLDWQDAKEGKSDYINIFVPWYWDDGYVRNEQNLVLTDEEKDMLSLYRSDGLTPGHLAWRRFKLQDFDGDYEQKCRGFRQEYPFTDEEAFLNSINDSFITIEPVQRARKQKFESDSNLVMGVDPNRGGTDKTAICWRRGRVVAKIETYHFDTTTDLAHKLKGYIDRDRPSKVFIDSIGIGAGTVDRVIEMGYNNVIGVNVARHANDRDKFGNLRAELWHEMREWFLQDMPVSIPDDPELQKELCGLGFHYRTGKLMIESKDDAKKRGMASPNKADSLMLTFAYGQYAGSGEYKARYISDTASGMLI